MSKGKSCCVPLCPSTGGNCNDLSFHEIPCDEDRRRNWLKNISRRDDTNKNKDWVPGGRAMVCSRHFQVTDFREDCARKILKRTATPSVFPEYPSYKKPKVEVKRKPLKRLNAVSTLNQNENRFKNSGPEIIKEVENNPATNLDIRFSSLPTADDINVAVSSNQQSIKSQAVQFFVEKISMLEETVATLKKKLSNMERSCESKDVTIEILQHQIDQQNKNQSPLLDSVLKIEEEALKGQTKAFMLQQQIKAYGKKSFRWSEQCIRMCVLWRCKSPKSYKFARAQFVNLPSVTTLRRYMGPSSLETGITSLAVTRLKVELKGLEEHGKLCSLIFDEMSIQPRAQYRRQADKVIGFAQYGNRKANPLANKLLCFVLKGLSTNYRIPVAYFPVRQLQSSDLSKLIMDVLRTVEEIGFFVCRLVADDATVNVKALEIICKGNLSAEIPHPIREGEPLFISFDACHIIKNVRNQFLDEERNLKKDGHLISSKPIKVLYECQKKLPIKPVRWLSRKVVDPTNFEKMNVMRALKIFSTELIAALEYCMSRKMRGFKDLDATLEFMKMIKKWFEIHNIANRTHHIVSRNNDKEEFWLVDDERLDWLENEFLNYLDSWKNYAMQQPKKSKSKTQTFLTKETYTAIRITTLSTVACIKYLLKAGFHYVLTRKFTSDDIEGIFSCVRAAQGYNDQANMASSIYALERILKTGLFSSSSFGNTATSNNDTLEAASETKRNVLQRFMPSPEIIELNAKQMKIVSKLSNPPKIKTTTVKNAGLAMVAGWMLRLLKDRHTCSLAGKNLIGNHTEHVNQLINFQSRGGLLYPTEQFISFLSLILDILEMSPNTFEKEALVKSWSMTLINLLPPQCLNCGCGDSDHSLLIKQLILNSVCKIYFQNVSFNITNTFNQPRKLVTKPLSKKVKKL